jgi:hypothetical protein
MVIENVEIGFLRPGDEGQQTAPCLHMLQSTSEAEGTGGKLASISQSTWSCKIHLHRKIYACTTITQFGVTS